MSEHYFTPKPSSAARRTQLELEFRGRRFRFFTEAGVFSPRHIDAGTRLLAEAMEVQEEDTVLDLGCGYGVLGVLAAGLASRGRAYLVDINERAAALARDNLALNGVSNGEARNGTGWGRWRGSSSM